MQPSRWILRDLSIYTLCTPSRQCETVFLHKPGPLRRGHRLLDTMHFFSPLSCGCIVGFQGNNGHLSKRDTASTRAYTSVPPSIGPSNNMQWPVKHLQPVYTEIQNSMCKQKGHNSDSAFTMTHNNIEKQSRG